MLSVGENNEDMPFCSNGFVTDSPILNCAGTTGCIADAASSVAQEVPGDLPPSSSLLPTLTQPRFPLATAELARRKSSAM